MRFDEDSQLDTSQVQDTRGRGGFPRGGGVAIGGGAGVLGLIVFVLLQLLGGGGTTSALPGVDQVQGADTNLKEECQTGADANTKQDCRVVAVVNSVQEFWAAEFQRRGAQYRLAPTQLFSGATRTGCGAASSEVGPFYCPRDGTVYIDLGFYQELQTKFGAQGGPFAQAYVLAHEYGHHVQDLTGTMERAGNRRSGAQSDSVRLELQADCYAGLWANHATTEPGAIGDDRIQERFQGTVNPETWTHGSSAQRQKWFEVGYRTGDLDQCDTFRGTV
jgi:predicted metalloprotease